MDALMAEVIEGHNDLVGALRAYLK